MGGAILARGSLNPTSVVIAWSWLSCCQPDDGFIEAIAEEDVFEKEVELLLPLLPSVDNTWKGSKFNSEDDVESGNRFAK